MANHPGTNKLARVIAGRIRDDADTSLVLDFGEVTEEYALVTDTFPVPVPKSDYVVDKRLISGTDRLKPGNRVLVAWVEDTPAVLCVIAPAKKLSQE